MPKWPPELPKSLFDRSVVVVKQPKKPATQETKLLKDVETSVFGFYVHVDLARLFARCLLSAKTTTILCA
jgi:hypothetical protein